MFSWTHLVAARVANRPLFQRAVLYLNPPPRPCPLLNLELSFICRAEKNLLQERKYFAKVQSNRGCVAQPMENRVLTFFFWRPPCPRAVFLHGGLQKKKGQQLITHPNKNRGSPIEDCPLKYRTVGNSSHSVLY